MIPADVISELKDDWFSHCVFTCIFQFEVALFTIDVRV